MYKSFSLMETQKDTPEDKNRVSERHVIPKQIIHSHL